MGYNILRKLFRKNKNPEQECCKGDNEINQIGKIVLILDDQGFLNIDCEWTESETIESDIAEMLYLMDKGTVAATAMSIISAKIGEEKGEELASEFLSKIIIAYALMSAQEHSGNEEPVVKPTNLFKLE